MAVFHDFMLNLRIEKSCFLAEQEFSSWCVMWPRKGELATPKGKYI